MLFCLPISIFQRNVLERNLFVVFLISRACLSILLKVFLSSEGCYRFPRICCGVSLARMRTFLERSIFFVKRFGFILAYFECLTVSGTKSPLGWAFFCCRYTFFWMDHIYFQSSDKRLMLVNSLFLKNLKSSHAEPKQNHLKRTIIRTKHSLKRLKTCLRRPWTFKVTVWDLLIPQKKILIQAREKQNDQKSPQKKREQLYFTQKNLKHITKV